MTAGNVVLFGVIYWLGFNVTAVLTAWTFHRDPGSDSRVLMGATVAALVWPITLLFDIGYLLGQWRRARKEKKK
jgi:hypothetical protein